MNVLIFHCVIIIKSYSINKNILLNVNKCKCFTFLVVLNSTQAFRQPLVRLH